MTIIFFASITRGYKDVYEIGDTEWEAWKQAAMKHNIEITNDMFLVKSDNYNNTICVVKKDNDISFDKNQRIIKNGSDKYNIDEYDEIYIHGAEKAKEICENLRRLGKRAASYTATTKATPFKPIVKRIKLLHEKGVDEFLKSF